MHIRVLMIAAAALVAIGCGAGESADEAPAANGSEVEARDIAFQPDRIEVTAGTTVSWTNEDSVAHTVTSGAPGEPDGEFDEMLSAGDTVTITFDESGTHAYYCEFHRNMIGEVVVTD